MNDTTEYTGLIPFTFEGTPISIITRDGEPWFVLADVCRVLEIGNPSDAARRLDDDEKHTLDNVEGGKINGLGTVGAMPIVINESGLYSLILTSRKPAAKRFKKWVTGDVLPTIRKTGNYGAQIAIADIHRQLADLRAASAEIHASNAELRMQLAEIRVNPYARLTVDMMTACEVRNAHVADRKHGPKPAAISAKLTAWISRRGNLGNVHRTAERDGAKRLFQRGDVYEWLKHEGECWIRSVVDGKRGQQSLRLVPLPQPQPTV